MAKRLKVFGIGLNKTGTSSLKLALTALGYRHFTHSTALTKAYAKGEWDKIEAVADAFESFDDWPWPLVWQRMADRYGDTARFVLTLRSSPEKWIESLKKHAERSRPGGIVRRIAYGHDYPHGREAEHIARYLDHAAAIRAHFAQPGRQGQMIELCWETGHGWAELCGFLGEPLRATPFPHANASGSAPRNPEQAAENARRIAARLAARGTGKG